MNRQGYAPNRRYWIDYKSYASLNGSVASNATHNEQTTIRHYRLRSSHGFKKYRIISSRQKQVKYKQYWKRNLILKPERGNRSIRNKNWRCRGIFMECPLLMCWLGVVLATAVSIEMSIYMSLEQGKIPSIATTTTIYEATSTTVVFEETTTPEVPTKVLNYKTIYINPGDYRAFSINDDNGNTVIAFGEKDNNGSLVTVDTLEYIPSSGSKLYLVLDSSSFVTQVIADNVVIKFQWLPDLSAVSGSAIARNGSIQANFQVDLNDTLINNNTYNIRSKRSLSDIYDPLSGYLYFKHESETNENGHNRYRRQLPILPKVNIRVSVESCKEQVTDAFTISKIFTNYSVSGNKESWADVIEYPGKSADIFPNYPGYHLYLPLSPSMSLTSGMCDAIEAKVTENCINITMSRSFIKKACDALRNTLSHLKTLSATDVEDIVKSCSEIVNGIDLFCSGFVSSDANNPALFNSTCNASDISDLYSQLQDDFLINPYAILSDGTVKQGSNRIPSQLSPNLANVFYLIDAGFNLQFQMSSLTTNPTDPDAKQSYVTTVKYRCVFFGNMHMYIIGTDDYENAVKCNVLNSCSCCTLKVPGADALVRDKWIIRYKDLNNITRFERQIAVVF